MSLDVQCRGFARLLVARHVERCTVPRRDARIAVRRELRPGTAEREVDVEEDGAELGQPGATGVGQRYAFVCRFASDGNFARILARCARSSSAEITDSSSG